MCLYDKYDIRYIHVDFVILNKKVLYAEKQIFNLIK